MGEAMGPSIHDPDPWSTTDPFMDGPMNEAMDEAMSPSMGKAMIDRGFDHVRAHEELSNECKASPKLRTKEDQARTLQ